MELSTSVDLFFFYFAIGLLAQYCVLFFCFTVSKSVVAK